MPVSRYVLGAILIVASLWVFAYMQLKAKKKVWRTVSYIFIGLAVASVNEVVGPLDDVWYIDLLIKLVIAGLTGAVAGLLARVFRKFSRTV